MKHLITCSLILGLSINSAQADKYASLRKEIEQSIARGNNWLLEQQKADGYWDDNEIPAFSALALNAIVRDPNVKRENGKFSDRIEQGYQWLLKQQKEDGGFYNRGLGTYNTATSLTSLLATGRKEFEPAIVKARKYLVGAQWDEGEKGKADNHNDGGIGYGSDDSYTNLSTTYLAIEAIALSESVIADGKYGKQPSLNWDAALTFLSRCQNLEETNDQEWANDDPRVKGGVIYAPGQSKGKDIEAKDGRVALRSYGSMTYAGMLSMIYAKVDINDPRVSAMKSWLGDNYTLDENPGLGPQGIYYYFQAMAKALTAAQMDTLPLTDGTEVDWRTELGSKLLQLQRENGSWVNDNGRFMESNAVLVTSYSILALEQLYDSLPAR